MDPLERELRDLLTSDRRDLPSSLVPLERVHAGASRRRRRRAAVASAATAVVVLAVAGTAANPGFLRGDDTPVADSTPTVSRGIATTPEPTSTAPTTVIAPSGPAWGGARAISVTATSTRTFVVLGELGDTSTCNQVNCLRLAETHDGGQTFSTLPLPEDAKGLAVVTDRNTATQVRFGSGQDGWLFGDGLWSTHDGGQSWSRVSTPGRVNRLAAAAGTAWALVPTRRGDNTQQLWRSAVGTDDWSRVPGVSVTGPGDLAVQGDRVVVVGTASSPVWVGGTDGFESQPGPCADALQAEVSAVSSFWVKCVTGTLAHLAVSPDGASWTDVPLSTDNGAVPNSAALGARTDREALVGLGVDPVLGRVSSDGTVTALRDLPPRDGAQATYVGFTTPDVGYLILVSNIYRTDDGGDTWRELAPGGS